MLGDHFRLLCFVLLLGWGLAWGATATIFWDNFERALRFHKIRLYRERVAAVLNYQPYGHLPVVHFGYWPETMMFWCGKIGHRSK